MSAGDVAAIAHKGDFPMPQAGGSPSYSFERTYAKVGVLVRISGGRMFATLDLLSNGRAETRLAIAAPMPREPPVSKRSVHVPIENLAKELLLPTARVAINYVESRKSHSVPGRKVSLQMSADRFSSDGAENVG